MSKDKINKNKIDRLELDRLNMTKRLRESQMSKDDKKLIQDLLNEVENLNKRVNKVEKPVLNVPFRQVGKVVETYWCYFLIGSNRGYDTSTLITQEELITHITNFQNKYWKDSMSVSVVPNNTIVFKEYSEMCYCVEAINYPRFPKEEHDICEFMLTLMEYLAINLEQQRITLVTPTKSIMLENTRLVDELAIKAEKK